MRVKMSQTVQGRVADNYWSPSKGDELEVGDAVGAALCERGFATPVVTKSKPVEVRKQAAPAAPAASTRKAAATRKPRKASSKPSKGKGGV